MCDKKARVDAQTTTRNRPRPSARSAVRAESRDSSVCAAGCAPRLCLRRVAASDAPPKARRGGSGSRAGFRVPFGGGADARLARQEAWRPRPPQTIGRTPQSSRRNPLNSCQTSHDGSPEPRASALGLRGRAGQRCRRSDRCSRAPRRGATPRPGTDQPRRRALHHGARVVTSSLPVALWRRWTSFPWRSCRSRAAVLAAAHIRPVFRSRRPALRPAWPRRITGVAGLGSPLEGGRQLFGILLTGDKRPRAWRARRRRAARFEVPPSAGCPDP